MTLTGCRRSKWRKKGRSGWRIKNMKTRRTWIINNLKLCRKCYAVLWTQVLSVILFVVLKLQYVSGLPLEFAKTYFWSFFKVSDIVGLVWAWEYLKLPTISEVMLMLSPEKNTLRSNAFEYCYLPGWNCNICMSGEQRTQKEKRKTQYLRTQT